MKANTREKAYSPYTMAIPNFSSTKFLTKLSLLFLLSISLFCVFHSLKLIYHSHDIITQNPLLRFLIFPSPATTTAVTPSPDRTELRHVVFVIAASAKLWDRRKNYIKVWWKPEEMRGFVWLDKPVNSTRGDEDSLPLLKISGDTSGFNYANRKGDRSAIRISRVVSETLRLGAAAAAEEEVRWFVLGDDDTVFVPDNLIRVLNKYDHNEFFYIGGSSESHLQNIHFSYHMAYGGGGIAISYPLAKALEKMQDRCIQRYPALYGSDDRIQACMAELGVPLTKEVGFHQFDVYGNAFGLLTAHPIAPLISLHHLDVVEPIFPFMSQVRALQRLKEPMKLDSAALMQQSICYDRSRNWTVSVSWGYAVQLFGSIVMAREMEIPSITFLDWYRKADSTGFAFNTRRPYANPCETPSVYMLANARHNSSCNWTTTEYYRYWAAQSLCKWKRNRKPSPFGIGRVEVYKKPDPHMWDKAPRRNCCRILPSDNESTIAVEVGECREDEIIEL